MVREVMTEANIPFVEREDEAAFYGPKIDVQIWSAIGREFTLATNQVDFAQGQRFNLSFTNQHNEAETPLIIHRAPLGTHERFIGFLLEHYAGRFPLWLAPLQVKILPISDKFLEYSKNVLETLEKYDIRVEIDERAEKVGRKIRDAEVGKVPCMLIIGEKEVNDGLVTLRRHGKKENESLTVDTLVGKLQHEIKEMIDYNQEGNNI